MCQHLFRRYNPICMTPERWSMSRLYPLWICVLAVLIFGSTLRAGFMLDDAFLLPRLKPAWTLANLRSDLTSNVHDDPSTYLYRPLQKMMVRLQHSLSGESPVGYHAVSLFFHVLNSLLVAQMALALGCPPLAAFWAGSFYAVHPLIVDDLLAATGGESMAIFFVLASLLLLFQPGARTYVLGLAVYVLALLAKESAVMIPFVLALMFYVVD